MTNFEKITQSEEELAKFIAEMMNCCILPVRCSRYGFECVDCMMNWFKQEAEE